MPLTVSCFSKIQIGFIFLVPTHLGSPGQRAIKRVCVCVMCTEHVAYVRGGGFGDGFGVVSGDKNSEYFNLVFIH